MVAKKRKTNKETVLILHNIRSNHNVGSIFRTADAGGVNKIFLTGYTPRPTDRFGRIVKEIAKTALGAEKSIAWEHFVDVTEVIKKLKKEDYLLIALEQSSKSVDYKKVKVSEKFALILGNEVDGIESNILNLCDVVAEIPMKGQKESLNVSVAAGIALFRILNI